MMRRTAPYVLVRPRGRAGVRGEAHVRPCSWELWEPSLAVSQRSLFATPLLPSCGTPRNYSQISKHIAQSKLQKLACSSGFETITSYSNLGWIGVMRVASSLAAASSMKIARGGEVGIRIRRDGGPIEDGPWQYLPAPMLTDSLSSWYKLVVEFPQRSAPWEHPEAVEHPHNRPISLHECDGSVSGIIWRGFLRRADLAVARPPRHQCTGIGALTRKRSGCGARTGPAAQGDHAQDRATAHLRGV